MVSKRIYMLAVVILMGIAAMYVWTSWPYWVTTRRLNEQLRVCYKNRSEIPTEIELGVLDGWDRPLIYSRQVSPELIVHGIVSRGPDGVLGTDDDMVVIKTDLNKSKIIGKWTGDKAREALKGFLDGFHRDSEFEEN